jgi:hypothetical protein
MNDPWFHFVLGLLATWRVAYLLAYEDGPWDLMVRLRTALGHGFFGRLIDCFHCVSLWVAAPVAFAIGRGPLEWALMWLGLSGGACLLGRVGRDPVVFQRLRSEDDDNGMLRAEEGGGAGEPTQTATIARDGPGQIRIVR